MEMGFAIAKQMAKSLSRGEPREKMRTRKREDIEGALIAESMRILQTLLPEIKHLAKGYEGSPLYPYIFREMIRNVWEAYSTRN